ncbi:hypothetical protein Cyast_2726 [Cyanobacterium stanieri PCC 7202]|uniref:Uncharacterized protein n=1 Tax=Cyanobacterium stanieri (strain ATCC 29140 / PCC 7202) TaxID=292563 RepID=K9YRE8_CYASC|nr:hypothetical protein Cyast_2726 [Cyanobacterium stanieri PCC 7202]
MIKNRYLTKVIVFFLISIGSLFLWRKTEAQDLISTDNKCVGEITELSSKLVADIGDYGNRVIQTSRRRERNSAMMPIYIVTAGQPEFEELPLSNRSYGSNKPSEIKQVFFTTLERHYLSDRRLEETQNYHWLLLTPTDRGGWEMVMLLTRFGEVAQSEVISPPIDTTSGVMGEAVRRWLRDCRYGVLR